MVTLPQGVECRTFLLFECHGGTYFHGKAGSRGNSIFLEWSLYGSVRAVKWLDTLVVLHFPPILVAFWR